MPPATQRDQKAEFAQALASGRFVITTEETTPKGANLSSFRKRVEALRGVVDAVNVTESSGAVMTMSPIGVMPLLLNLGLDPILQITCRDRNRIALQADLLAAMALGVRNFACMAGDPIEAGDHPEAKAVHDLNTPGLLRALRGLAEGHDLHGAKLSAVPPEICAGAVVNPGAEDLDAELARMEQKAEAGAQFFQTQAVYEPAVFQRFMTRAERIGVPIIAGFIVLKSAAMARRLNETLPGIHIPDAIIRELDAGQDRTAKSIEISARILTEVKASCRGLHVIAVGWESHLPAILESAGVRRQGHGQG